MIMVVYYVIVCVAAVATLTSLLLRMPVSLSVAGVVMTIGLIVVPFLVYPPPPALADQDDEQESDEPKTPAPAARHYNALPLASGEEVASKPRPAVRRLRRRIKIKRKEEHVQRPPLKVRI